MKFNMIFLIIFLFSCHESNNNNFTSIQKDSVILKGDIKGDTLFNDTINYYDLSNNLIGKKYFNYGKQEGISIDYYLNKKIMRTSFYNDGLKNGENTYYDTAGKCTYKDFYYYDLPVGPIIFYDSNENAKRYFFINLQNQTILDIDYSKWNGINDIYSKCTYFTYSIQRTDTTREVSLLLYIMNPPKLSFTYSILKKNKTSGNEYKVIEEVYSKFPFIKRTLPELPADETYSIGLTVFDSILNKKSVIYDDF